MKKKTCKKKRSAVKKPSSEVEALKDRVAELEVLLKDARLMQASLVQQLSWSRRNETPQRITFPPYTPTFTDPTPPPFRMEPYCLTCK
jgi:uncharacterized protein (DUF2384 family)